MSPAHLRGIGAFAPHSDEERSLWARLTDFVSTQPRAFTRDASIGGHVTGSALVLSPDGGSALLTHHRKLGLWLQLGGHCDGIEDARFVALKEAYEESGLPHLTPVSDAVFDIDILPVPAFGNDPFHWHYDVRFLLQADRLNVTVSDESHALDWVPLTEFETRTTEPTMLRMRDKALAFLQT